MIVTWAILLLIGIFAWAPARLLSSLVLAAAAWRGSPRLIAAGMTMGFLGDVAIAEVFFAGPASFYLGMGCFAIGHVLYIRALTFVAPMRASRVVPWLVFGVAAWWLVMFDPASFPGPLPIATLGYTLLLATMAAVAGVGGALFFFSDLFLGMSLFEPRLFAMLPALVRETIVWLLYGPAQAIIVFTNSSRDRRPRA